MDIINNQAMPKMTIRSLIERSFIFAMSAILMITLIAAVYFNKHILQERRDSNSQKIHEILSNLITPVLTISDVAEIRRLLQLASSPDETFVVVDNIGSVLMPDYTKISLVKSLIKPEQTTVTCESFKTFHKIINGNGYWINCSVLKNDDVLRNNKNLGILISFSNSKWLSLSPMFFIFICVFILILLLIVIWFRQIIYHRLLRPLLTLGSQVVAKSKSPLTVSPSIDDIGSAPYEVVAIKNAFEILLLNLQKEYQHRIETDKKSALLDLAAQVAHDIRSPLAVMDMMLKCIVKSISKEEANIQREAIQSVRNIANNLLDRYREPDEKTFTFNKTSVDTSNEEPTTHPIFIATLIDRMVSQKLLEWANNPCEITINIQSEARLICINAAPTEIKRALSNLLNNAYESLTHKRQINIELEFSQNLLNLLIHDSGCGIPPANIQNVLAGESSKHRGKGLGLSGAKRFIESLGGKLSLRSDENIGTTIILSFAICPNPTWLPQSIKISANVPIILLDDDPCIHSLWRQRLNQHAHNLHHFHTSDNVLKWCETNQNLTPRAIYLMDYEIKNSPCNGLDILLQINAKERGYLITSHEEERAIQLKIVEAGLWLIPKSILDLMAIDV